MIIGVDIGGSKIMIGLFDTNLRLIKHEVTDTNQNLSGTDLYYYLERAIINISADYKINSIGCGCPGPINAHTGEVSPTYIPAWKNFPLQEHLKRKFRVPICIENDAKLFALAEALFGAGVNQEIVLGAVVSTGIGAGIVINKKLFHGATGNAGHMGHVIVDYKGEPCPKGGIGCITTIASGTSIRRHASFLLGQENSAREVFNLADSGDERARRIIIDAASAMAATIASSVHLLDPNIVVIGGSLGLKSDFFWQEILKYSQQYLCLEFSRNVKIVRGKLGDFAGITGAAALVSNI